MKKINIVFALLMTISTCMFAQQDPMFAHYQFNQLALNPAYAGSNDYTSFVLTTRHQWIGLEGAPQTQTFSVNTPLENSIGFGLNLGRDVAGPVTTFMFEANFSYKLKVSEKSNLNFGLMGGFNNSSVKLSNLVGINPEDVSFHNNVNVYKPVFGAGLYYSHPSFFAGLSVPDLVESDYAEQSVTWTHKRHYYLNAGYLGEISENVKFRPALMMRYVPNTPFSAELTTSLIFKDKIWFGLIYRLNDAVGALAAVQINNQFRISYSYDYTTSILRPYQGGSHEISVSYDLDNGSKKHTSPRYF
jgi:type IX secretion system PorP/SprF family membrane protein